VNIGELETKGFEAQLDYLVIDKKDFEWTLSGNYSTFKTKLIKFNELENASLLIGNIGPPGLNNTYIIKLAEGEEIGQIMAPKFVRYNENGEAVLLDKEGNETINRNTEDFIVAGQGLPDFNLGINNTFQYKNFDLNFFFRGSFGHYLANIQRAYFEHSANIGKGNIVLTKEFSEADKGSDAWHDGYVEKASFLKLDNASLGYTFKLPQTSVIRGLRLYVTGQNLFTITNYTGSDPEVRYFDPGPTTEGNRQNQYDGNILAPGIDRRVTYLPTRTYTFGVNVGF
jgi:iron complex outermembrane receptor protein